MAGIPRLIVLVSDAGSHLQALIDARNSGSLTAELVLVVSDHASAYGLERARLAGIETLCFPFKPYGIAGESRRVYDSELAAALAAYDPDLILLAGWTPMLSAAFLDRFPRHVITLHPALPGHFHGVGAVERAYAAYHRGEIQRTGCTVQYVTPALDAGPVVAQTIVPFKEGEPLEDFELRMHTAEHQLIVRGTQRALLDLAVTPSIGAT